MSVRHTRNAGGGHEKKKRAEIKNKIRIGYLQDDETWARKFCNCLFYQCSAILELAHISSSYFHEQIMAGQI